MDRDQYEIMREGRELSPKAAKELEAQVEIKPSDFNSRLKLLAYYFSSSMRRSPKAVAAHSNLVSWFIKNHPDHPVLGTPEGTVDHIRNPVGYQKVRRQWENLVDAGPKDAKIAFNAAIFLMRAERNLAESLFLKAQDLEPDDPRISRELGHFYRRQVHRVEGEERTKVATQSMKQFERAMERHGRKFYRYTLLGDAARAAFEAGETEKSRKYAEELLEMANSNEEFAFRTGNAIHHGNLVLGRLALKAGDIEGAKRHLLEAGQSTGSPQLNSFGPNMLLAKELLEKGEKDVVQEYFDLCSKFWDREELNEWEAVIEKGQIPDFGANLRY